MARADNVDEHARECVLLWPLRRVATLQPNVGLDELDWHDERLAAHLDGLRVADAAGLDAVLAQAGSEPGAAWAAAILAAERGHPDALDAIDGVDPDALAVAAAWMDAPTAARAIDHWAARRPAAAIRAATARREASPAIATRIAPAIASRDRELAMAGLDAAGAFGLDLADHAARRRDDADAEVARAAARALALLTGDAAAAGRLLDAPGLADRLLAAAAGAGAGRADRAGVRAAAAGGDPATMPWLIARMREEPLRRLAGEACCAIAGCSLRPAGLAGVPGAAGGPTEDPADDRVGLDEDEHLDWPDPDAIARWWEVRRTQLPPGRLLAGRPLAEAAEVLRSGTQRLRLLAAWHRVRAGVRPLFPWDGPAPMQRALLREAR